MSNSSLPPRNDPSIWEYEAPQYCDFDSIDVFDVTADKESDDYFLTDHEARKENTSLDDSISDESDSFMTPFQTPLSVVKSNSNFNANKTITPSSTTVSNGGGGGSTVTKSLQFTDSPQIYPLRNTPLRDIYNNGGTPLRESRPSAIFNKRKTTGRQSSKPKDLQKVAITNAAAAASATATATATASLAKQQHDEEDQRQQQQATLDRSINRETFDLTDINVAIDQINNSLNSKTTTTTMVEIISNDDKKMNDFHTITENELEDEDEEIINNTDSLSNVDDCGTIVNCSTSRSSFIVKSPIMAPRVRFDEISLIHNNNGQQDDGEQQEAVVNNVEKGEDDNTTVHTTSINYNETVTVNITPKNEEMRKKLESIKKIKSRQLTPMFTGKKSSSSNGAKQIDHVARLNKYIKRFSKNSPIIEMNNDNDNQVEVEEPTKQSKQPAQTKSNSMVRNVNNNVKKRVTIAASATNNIGGSSSAGDGGRRHTLKKSHSLTFRVAKKFNDKINSHFSAPTCASINRAVAASGAKSKDKFATNVKPSPYRSLAEMSNNFFLSSVRKYIPFKRQQSKPKITKPKAPNLMTETRASVRRYHTMPDLMATGTKTGVTAQVKSKPTTTKTTASSSKSSSSKLSQIPPKQHKTTASTKPITPQFSTDVRIKVWHAKHDEIDGGSGGGNGNGQCFKARPVPNFARLQAKEEERKREMQRKLKQENKHNKVQPFNFESRAHSEANSKH